jgi:glycosyltransferase involved in cell wall biosynthesis
VIPARPAINAVFLEPGMGGLETYVRELVPELVRAAPGMRLSIVCNPVGRELLAAEPWADEVELVVHPLIGRRGLRAASELTLLGALASRRFDVLHSVALTGPLRTRAAHVVVIADVTWIVEPTHGRGQSTTVRLWQAVVPQVARRADRVLAISQAGAEHIREHLRIPADRIDVVPLGHGLRGGVTPTPEPELRRRLGLGEGRLVFTVGAKKVHKNQMALVRALPRLREAHPDATLVLAGAPTPHEDELRAEAERLGLNGSVVFLGYVDDADLEGLYRAATAFAFPSVNEGFGLPLLEAMARDLPVACANVSAMPEVAGDAALQFDPYSIDAVADALIRVVGDAALREDLVRRGRARLEAFSWARSAEGTLESWSRALAGR